MDHANATKVAILYATREGHTRRVAAHLGMDLKKQGVAADCFDLASVRSGPALDAYDEIVLAASVHFGRHEREMLRFVKEHRAALERKPTLFVSVSMAEAAVEDPARTPEQRAQAAAAVREATERFVKATGWTPRRIVPVAGALRYTHYNFVLRWIMRRIARAEGSPTDTKHDHVLTDWTALNRLAGELVELPRLGG